MGREHLTAEQLEIDQAYEQFGKDYRRLGEQFCEILNVLSAAGDNILSAAREAILRRTAESSLVCVPRIRHLLMPGFPEKPANAELDFSLGSLSAILMASEVNFHVPFPCTDIAFQLGMAIRVLRERARDLDVQLEALTLWLGHGDIRTTESVSPELDATMRATILDQRSRTVVSGRGAVQRRRSLNALDVLRVVLRVYLSKEQRVEDGIDRPVLVDLETLPVPESTSI
jgi:hypothetical protein